MLPLLAAGLILGASSLARAEEGKSSVLVGVDGRENSTYGYVGMTHHFGTNALGDGIIGRAVAYGGDYEYTTNAVVGNRVKADFSAAEVLVGYQKVFTGFTLRGYLGAEYEGHQLSPNNPYDHTRGDSWGAKVRGEFETDFAAPNYANVIATYGSATERYWLRGRVGRDFSGYVVGPEVIATGNRAASEGRVGVFLNFRNLLPSLLSISAGQAKTSPRSAGYTPYFNVEYTYTF